LLKHITYFITNIPEIFLNKIGSVTLKDRRQEMPITNQEKWDIYVEKNDDPYGGCCINVAREVMRVLDTDEYPEGKIDTHKIICDADKNIKAGGITGFMAGAVASMVAQCHSRGQEFRLNWNNEHGVGEDDAKGGTVNPAIMTIGEKDE
jgi:hypothetical protein